MLSYQVSALLASLSIPNEQAQYMDTERVLREYEARAPIEITFAGPPRAADRTTDEDEALIRRMQDELDVEKRVLRRDDRPPNSSDSWEERMNGLNGVTSGRSKYETMRDDVPNADDVDALRRKARRSPASSDSSEHESDSESSQEESE